MKNLNKILTISLLLLAVGGVAFWNSTKIKRAGANYSPLIMKSFWNAPMPTYPGAKEMPLSQKMTMGNTKVKMAWFRTQDEPLAVARYYTNIWRNRGHHITEDIHPFGGKVSAIDIKYNLQRQLIMERKGTQTTVFVSLIMGKLMKLSNVNPKAETPLIPIYPGAEGIMSYGSNDRLSNSKTISFVSRGSMEDTIAFYETEMTSRGFKLATNSIDKLKKLKNLPTQLKSKMTLLVFAKDKEEISVSISSIEGSKRTRVQINKMEGKGE
jgi:hypothetical protein